MNKFFSSTFMSMSIIMLIIYTVPKMTWSWVMMNPILAWVDSLVSFSTNTKLFSQTVMIISTLIIIFSLTYMSGSKSKKIFFILLLSFVASMIMFINSESFIFLLMGWDGLGISSFLLIMFYSTSSSTFSSLVTVFMNRVGDTLVIMSIALMLEAKTFNFYQIKLLPMTPMILFLLVTAAFTKSAQFPFSAWLPAAMAAPTPISALVHSSTLVTAGVFIITQNHEIFNNAQLNMMMMSGSFTLIAASLAATMTGDMKKIIALSTLSQLSIMIMTLALGLKTYAFCHLLVHAMFKALLFLSAGYFIHHSMNNQDKRKIKNTIYFFAPVVHTFVLSMMALAALPFMASFYSKHLIIETSNLMLSETWVHTLLAMSSVLTFIYSFQLLNLVLKAAKKNKVDNMTDPFNKDFITTNIFTLIVIFEGAMFNWVTIPTPLFSFMTFINKMIMLTATISPLFMKNTMFMNSMKSKKNKMIKYFLFQHLLFSSVISMKFMRLTEEKTSVVELQWMESVKMNKVNQSLVKLADQWKNNMQKTSLAIMALTATSLLALTLY